MLALTRPTSSSRAEAPGNLSEEPRNGRIQPTTTEAGFIEAIAREVAAKLYSQIGIKQRLMSMADAATYLGMTPAALRHKVDEKNFPVIRDGRTLRFDKRELDGWIDRAPREGC